MVLIESYRLGICCKIVCGTDQFGVAVDTHDKSLNGLWLNITFMKLEMIMS